MEQETKAKALVKEMHDALGDEYSDIKQLLGQIYVAIDKQGISPRVNKMIGNLQVASTKPHTPYPKVFNDDLEQLKLLTRTKWWNNFTVRIWPS
ncbi:hypothetical protein [Lacticaseibacillus saniviri]|uniref:hypothetical protein n=1 Tax=Lacticaseibacillus saniviri TaxID=931533 RepID=UPI00138F0BFA|nr:hypothetical protein [Lacticaseibacillus saniviri]